MGEQLIKAPDGTMAVWSSVVDDIVVYGIESVEEFAAWRAERARAREYQRSLDEGRLVADGRAEEVYYQFTMDWDEMQELRTFRHGEPWQPDPSDVPIA